MPSINILDQKTAELIAAGEVVERPASVVKELLENALDSGADSITVEIKNGGKTYIRVSDNGCGIAMEDLPKAILRHATSKISSEDDLNAIGTLGFRGEALASIAAVSRLQILSCEQNETIGYRLEQEGENRVYFGEAGSPKGTTVVVKDLFFNTPARMKFLKKDSTESSYIQNICEKVFLSNPGVSFRFIKDGETVISTTGDGKLISAVHSIYGASFSDGLINLQYSMGGFSAMGLISKPIAARSNRNMQIFFVNGRYVKSKTLYAAIEEAYRGSIMVGKFPSCVLFIEMPLDSVDVNVHPAKTEVRFADEKRVFEIVYRSAKEAILASETILPESSIKAVYREPIIQPELTKKRVFEPTEADSQIRFVSSPSIDVVKTSEELSEDKISKESFRSLLDSFGELYKQEKITATPTEPIFTDTKETTEEKVFVYLGELFKTYILGEYGEDLVLIDKHAAHERMIYEELKLNSPKNNKQLLLAPVKITLNANEINSFETSKADFDELGFSVEGFSHNMVVVREAPINIPLDEIENAFLEILNKIMKNSKKIDSDFYDDLLHSVACRAAIKAHDHSTDLELREFAEKILRTETRYCPHGRPVIVKISKKEIEKKFFRI
jgi:DNA mismatch repair protein MutL